MHKDLEVWKKSMQLVTEIYLVTQSFPEEELYGLASQIRQSAVSIPSNISAGAARKENLEFISFLHLALGSKNVLETQLIIAFNLKYMSDKQHIDLKLKVGEIGKMILGLINYFKNKNSNNRESL
ncbi:four helix bundle protein [Flavobacterium sp. NKUCC04_CG]|uniref:four helix bundle protein n=1 Tax=Flavobacterium sp. NKUCC04_CG TaxID=2842121 RepID=UPI0021048114|nr:four helix bundle protein [Flavobacterium sp. NKUCC04_CG]